MLMMCRRSLLAISSISFIDNDEKTSVFTLFAEAFGNELLNSDSGINTSWICLIIQQLLTEIYKKLVTIL
jgi:hypothetical protein